MRRVNECFMMRVVVQYLHICTLRGRWTKMASLLGASYAVLLGDHDQGANDRCGWTVQHDSLNRPATEGNLMEINHPDRGHDCFGRERICKLVRESHKASNGRIMEEYEIE